MFQVRWEFEVRPERREEFIAAYGPAGAWVRLFKTGAGYLGTDLIPSAPTRWITVDRWESRASYDAFRKANAAAYATLDAQCEALTTAERKLDESGE